MISIQDDEQIRLDNERFLLDVATGHWKSRALNFALEAKIASHLVNGSKSAFTIAKEIGVNPEFLYRTMRALSSLGIFREEEEYGVFSQTPKSAIMAESSPSWTDGLLFESHDFTYKAWTSFRESVKEGKAMGPQSLGYESVWSLTEQNPSYAPILQRAMSSFTAQAINTIIRETDFSPFETIADIGGSQGVLLLNILKNNPSVKKGYNFDLPITIENNKSLVSQRESEFKNEMAKFEDVAGSFFDSVPEADCYTLKYIFHDWKDEKCVEILETISKSMKPNSKIYIFDSVIETKNQPNGFVWLDLHMMHYVDGRERSATEWKALANSAGFKVESVVSLGMIGRVILSKK
ncbi:hypothetical protein CYY_001160 [Polysphondylium violaceum]|uniref:O-methyltransferase family 2 protein n=1 Tax=Polysphondylium violaceum TaxID=133409 RepID=A0A8J4Q2G9_9MYCE|nr:hypothetical protein CYY_001160 [Polysphondylium violaceum]